VRTSNSQGPGTGGDREFKSKPETTRALGSGVEAGGLRERLTGQFHNVRKRLFPGK